MNTNELAKLIIEERLISEEMEDAIVSASLRSAYAAAVYCQDKKTAKALDRAIRYYSTCQDYEAWKEERCQ